MTEKQHPSKIVLIGNSGVGKTAIKESFVNKRLPAMQFASILAEFSSKTVTLPASESIEKPTEV